MIPFKRQPKGFPFNALNHWTGCKTWCPTWGKSSSEQIPCGDNARPRSEVISAAALPPLPGTGPTRVLLTGPVAVFGQPLAADVLHYGVLSSLCSPKDILDQRTSPAGLQLHRLQVSWSQLPTEQVSFDLQTNDRDQL